MTKPKPTDDLLGKIREATEEAGTSIADLADESPADGEPEGREAARERKAAIRRTDRPIEVPTDPLPQHEHQWQNANGRAPEFWELPASVITMAHTDPADEDALSVLLGAEGLGGRPIATLLITAVAIQRELAPVADDLSARADAAESAERHLEAAKRVRPTTQGEAVEQADEINRLTTAWSRALNHRGEAETAANKLAWLFSYLPGLFERKPIAIPQRHGKPDRLTIRGTLPPSLTDWFEVNRVDPTEFCGFLNIGRRVEQRPRIRLVSPQPQPQTRRAL